MNVTYGSAVALAIPVFLGLIAVELFTDWARGTRSYRLADSITNLSCGIISVGMKVFVGFIGLFSYEWVLNRMAPLHLSASHWATYLFAFVLYDFCYYWHHRFGHTVGLFWAAHVVHHQSEEFNLTTACGSPAQGPSVGGCSTCRWLFAVFPLAFT